jgi:hypothetical protein
MDTILNYFRIPSQRRAGVAQAVHRPCDGLDNHGSISEGAMMGFFLFDTASRPALGPTQPPIRSVPGVLTPEVKRPGRETDHRHLVLRLRIRGALPPLSQYVFMV